MNEILEPELVEELKTKSKMRDHATTSNSSVMDTEKFKKPVVSIDPLVDFKPSKTILPTTKDDSEIQYHETNKAVLGPGIVLKTLREELKLTQEDVAKELRLSVRHIASLEQDQFEKFTALAFYVGYLRNYARLLDADADKMLAKFYAVYKVMPENTNHKRTKTHTRVKLWYELWPITLFYNNNRLAAEKKHTKLFLSIILLSLSVAIWWLLSGSAVDSNQKLTLNTIDNKELESIPPETVDHLLPSSPVIVQAPKYNILEDIG